MEVFGEPSFCLSCTDSSRSHLFDRWAQKTWSHLTLIIYQKALSPNTVMWGRGHNAVHNRNLPGELGKNTKAQALAYLPKSGLPGLEKQWGGTRLSVPTERGVVWELWGSLTLWHFWPVSSLLPQIEKSPGVGGFRCVHEHSMQSWEPRRNGRFSLYIQCDLLVCSGKKKKSKFNMKSSQLSP